MARKSGLERKMGPPKLKKWGSWESIFTTFAKAKIPKFSRYAAAPLGVAPLRCAPEVNDSPRPPKGAKESPSPFIRPPMLPHRPKLLASAAAEPSLFTQEVQDPLKSILAYGGRYWADLGLQN